MPIHRIRLAGPWDSQLLDCDRQSVGSSIRIQLPFTLQNIQNHSVIQLTRGFHHPTGIGDKTSLRIVLQGSANPLEVRMNGVAISECDSETAGEYTFELIGLIEAFNQLSVLFTLPSSDSEVTLNTVWLEIRE
jgi:hypothetical protein